MAKSIITVTLTLRGDPAGVTYALAYGLPLEALVELRDGMTAELEQRKCKPARRRRVTVSKRKDRKR